MLARAAVIREIASSISDDMRAAYRIAQILQTRITPPRMCIWRAANCGGIAGNGRGGVGGIALRGFEGIS